MVGAGGRPRRGRLQLLRHRFRRHRGSEGGGRYPDAASLADRIAVLSPKGEGSRFVVCTGGEPVSPIAGAELVVTSRRRIEGGGAAAGLDPLDFAQLDFRRFSVQPMDGPGLNPEGRAANTEWAIRFCLARPQWQLSLQTHKVTGIR